MSYVNKVVVNGQEVNLNQLEGILDAEGHNRFIEGEGVTRVISGVTPQYNKWSLSGSHLMIVLAFKLDANATLVNYDILEDIDIPEWISNKIFALGDGSTGWIEVKDTKPYTNEGVPTGDPKTFILTKTSGGDLRVYYISANFTPDADRYFRVQFDLVIDNASA